MATENLGEDVITEAQQVEQDLWREKISKAEHLFIAVHSEGPSHYTLLEVHKNPYGNTIEYRDSLKIPSKAGHEAATRISKRRKSQESHENRTFAKETKRIIPKGA